MNAMAGTDFIVKRSEPASVEALHRKKYFWVAGFCTSMAFCVVSGVGGFMLSFASLLGVLNTRRIESTLMIMAAFPLAFLAAHCMDKVDSLQRDIREKASVTKR